MKRKSSTRRFNERKEQAIERQKSRNKLTNLEQIAILDKRLGVNVGATKERTRLSKKIEEVESLGVLEVKKEKFKVKKHHDPIKEKKKFKRQQKMKDIKRVNDKH